MTGVVGQAEVERAQAAVDTWIESPNPPLMAPGHVLELRGIIAAALADAHTDGYVAGVRRGRQEAAQIVADALHDEGLL